MKIVLGRVSAKIKELWSRKKSVLLVLVVILLGIVFLFSEMLVSSKSTKSLPQESEKTWRITIAYDREKDKLSFDSIAVVPKRIATDSRGADFSPYSIAAVDNKGNVLYKEKITITQRTLYDPVPKELQAKASPPQFSNTLYTTAYVPYFSSAEKIIVALDDTAVLEIPVKKQGFSLTRPRFDLGTPQAYAAPGTSCGPMKVVFISDGYVSYSDFHRDVRMATEAFYAADPYRSVAKQMFEFHSIDNSISLGCGSGFVKCIESPKTLGKIIEIVETSQIPDVAKAIVLSHVPLVDSSGVTNDVGGDLVIMASSTFLGRDFAAVAVHEFLGHAVGWLYDRYIYPRQEDQDSYANALTKGLLPKSNCSDSSRGEDFWGNAGIDPPSIGGGCTSLKLFAPSKRDCGVEGSHSTIMSTLACKASVFDRVEQYWITKSILSKYRSCDSGVSPTLVPTQTVAPTIAVVSPSPIPPVVATGEVKGTIDLGEKPDACVAPGSRVSIKISGDGGGRMIQTLSALYRPIGVNSEWRTINQYSINGKSSATQSGAWDLSSSMPEGDIRVIVSVTAMGIDKTSVTCSGSPYTEERQEFKQTFCGFGSERMLKIRKNPTTQNCAGAFIQSNATESEAPRDGQITLPACAKQNDALSIRVQGSGTSGSPIARIGVHYKLFGENAAWETIYYQNIKDQVQLDQKIPWTVPPGMREGLYYVVLNLFSHKPGNAYVEKACSGNPYDLAWKENRMTYCGSNSRKALQIVKDMRNCTNTSGSSTFSGESSGEASSNGASGGQTGASGSSGGGGGPSAGGGTGRTGSDDLRGSSGVTQAPTPGITCAPDPSCSQSPGAMQLCPLVCR